MQPTAVSSLTDPVTIRKGMLGARSRARDSARHPIEAEGGYSPTESREVESRPAPGGSRPGVSTRRDDEWDPGPLELILHELGVHRYVFENEYAKRVWQHQAGLEAGAEGPGTNSPPVVYLESQSEVCSLPALSQAPTAGYAFFRHACDLPHSRLSRSLHNFATSPASASGPSGVSMPTEQSTVNGRTTGNGRKSKRRANGRTCRHKPVPMSWTPISCLRCLTAVRKGDFSVKMPVSQVGVAGKISDALNDIIDLNRETAREFERVSQAVGKEGKITQRAHLHGAAGAWAASVNSVNTLIGDLVQPTSEVARVIGAVAKGDLSQTMALDIEGRPLMGEFLRIGKTVNTMVDQLSSFASEVTRVAREVGTEGKLGGQARVKGVAGTWKDLTDNVNSHGRQPDRPGPQHRPGHHRRRQRRPLQEDHRRRQGRNPRAQEHHQHDGGPAQLLRLRSDPRRPRSRAPKASSAARRR